MLWDLNQTPLHISNSTLYKGFSYNNQLTFRVKWVGDLGEIYITTKFSIGLEIAMKEIREDGARRIWFGQMEIGLRSSV